MIGCAEFESIRASHILSTAAHAPVAGSRQSAAGHEPTERRRRPPDRMAPSFQTDGRAGARLPVIGSIGPGRAPLLGSPIIEPTAVILAQVRHGLQVNPVAVRVVVRAPLRVDRLHIRFNLGQAGRDYDREQRARPGTRTIVD